MGQWQGESVELEITNVAHGGVSVARFDGRVVFVSDAIPGETVVARISDDSKSAFWRADTVSVTTASEFRQPHIWSAASIERAPDDRVGGAEFGHIAIGHQRELKRRVLADSLKRMAGIESDVVVEGLAGPEDGTGWRTRLRLHIASDGTVGPYAARSRRVIPVTELPLAVPEAAAVAPLDERFPSSEFVDVIVPSVGNSYVLVGDSTTRPHAVTITERVGERDFRVDARGFWQVHRQAATTLSAAVQDAIDESIFDPRAYNLDLYGGVGLLAAAVGDRFGSTSRITTVESDIMATGHATRNLAEWVGATAVTARVDRYLQQLSVSATAAERSRLARATVILDPPRSGAGTTVVDQLAELDPAQIIYVACDPVALSRDVALLGDEGYQLTRLRAFDLFPNTHHVEAVARLTKQ
jgi:tRNA/tmRNA/rRNA uracil-C5-methylase (TrmA/RlmC/RlmD family)